MNRHTNNTRNQTGRRTEDNKPDGKVFEFERRMSLVSGFFSSLEYTCGVQCKFMDLVIPRDTLIYNNVATNSLAQSTENTKNRNMGSGILWTTQIKIPSGSESGSGSGSMDQGLVPAALVPAPSH